MNILTEAIRKHHLQLAAALQAHALGIGSAEALTECEAFLAFLKGDLLPHAGGEELHLYPLVDSLMLSHGRPTATMTVDHEFIGGYVEKIEEITRDLASSSSADERQALLRRLRDLAMRLDAIFELHLAKEERVYLPLIEAHVGETRQRSLLDAIHEAGHNDEQVAVDPLLDVRNIIPRQRHTLIFDAFAGLKPGEAFVLINDHDPRPLYYQFQAEHTGRFSWSYLEQGPEVWRVRIGRRA